MIQFDNGACIYLPENARYNKVWLPDPHNDIDANQKYDKGTRLVKGQRSWYYAQVGDINGDGQTSNIRRGMACESQAVVNAYTGKLVTESGFNAADDEKVKLDMTTHVNFLSAATAVAVHDYERGSITIYDTSTGNYWGCMILDNTVEDSSGYVELTLESPLPFTLESTDIVQVEENMFWKVAHPGNSANYCAIVGFPCIWALAKTIAGGESVSDSEFIWLQTWGPYQGIIFGNAHGGAEGERAPFLCGTGYPDEDYYPGMAEHSMPAQGGFYTANNYKNGSPADFDYNYLTAFFLKIMR